MKSRIAFAGLILSAVFLGGMMALEDRKPLSSRRSIAARGAAVAERTPLFPLLQKEPPPVGAPHRLLIPSVGVEAEVEHVGRTPAGDMDVPSSPRNVGWYRFGSRPGETGNAVIAGHLDDEDGPAVFWRLKELKEGDEVQVVDSAGYVRSFVVTGAERYRDNDTLLRQAPFGASQGKQDRLLRRIFGASPAGSFLNLITCGGEWDGKAGSYRERLVVFTVAEDAGKPLPFASGGR